MTATALLWIGLSLLAPAASASASDWSCPQGADTDGDGQAEELILGESPHLRDDVRRIPLPVPASLVRKACLADLDGDGKAEVLISHTAATAKQARFADRLFVYRQEGQHMLRPVFLGSRGAGPLLDFTVRQEAGSPKARVLTWERVDQEPGVRVWTWEGYGLVQLRPEKAGPLPAPPPEPVPQRGAAPPAPASLPALPPTEMPGKLNLARRPGKMRSVRVGRNLKPAANARQFRFLPAAARRHLARHGFAVLQSQSAPAEVHALYIANQYERLPSFVTADAALHLCHLVFDKVLQEMELRLLAPGLARWTGDGAERARVLAPTLPPDLRKGMEDLSRRLRVAACLLEGEEHCRDPQVTRAREAIVQKRCPDFAQCQDPDGYKPRGHYLRDQALQRYFQARLWLAEGLSDWREVAAACLLLSRWPAGRTFIAQREKLERVLVGPRANRAMAESLSLAREKLGATPDWSDWAQKENWPSEEELRRKPISLLARRRTADNRALLAATDENLRPKPHPLDFLQALGSEEALKRQGAAIQAWPELARRLAEQRQAMEKGRLLDMQSVGGRWLAALRWLLLPFPKGYARFQQDPAWAGHALVSAAAAWTELRRDTVLYVQPPIVYMEGGDEAQLPPHRAGFVEPVPELYRELAETLRCLRRAYAEMGATSLNQRKRRTAEAGPLGKLDDMIGLLDFLGACAEKQLAGKALARHEHERLHAIGSEFEHIAAGRGKLRCEPVPVVADVFVVVDPQDGRRERLHMATGPLHPMVVAMPLGRRTVLARGVVSSFHSFWRPEPLDDGQWRGLLESGQAPAPVDWRKVFKLNRKKRRRSRH